MKKKIYIAYAKTGGSRGDKVVASLKENHRAVSRPKYDKEQNYPTIHFEVEVDIPDDAFKTKVFNFISRIVK